MVGSSRGWKAALSATVVGYPGRPAAGMNLVIADYGHRTAALIGTLQNKAEFPTMILRF